MTRPLPGYEVLREKLDGIIKRYREFASESKMAETRAAAREQAQKDIVELGFSAADARRWTVLPGSGCGGGG